MTALSKAKDILIALISTADLLNPKPSVAVETRNVDPSKWSSHISAVADVAAVIGVHEVYKIRAIIIKKSHNDSSFIRSPLLNNKPLYLGMRTIIKRCYKRYRIAFKNNEIIVDTRRNLSATNKCPAVLKFP